jgi:hypothetical protein
MPKYFAKRSHLCLNGMICTIRVLLLSGRGSSRGMNLTGGHQGRAHDPHELLRIYLDDHWAAAGAGTALANRIARENEGTQWYSELRRIADEIEADQETLRQLRSTLASDGFSLKRQAAKWAEKVGRLKLNGSLIGYTPLARVLELEGLIAGVKARQMLWRSLRHTEAAGRVDLDRLESTAGSQVDTLEAIHQQATALAFIEREPVRVG